MDLNSNNPISSRKQCVFATCAVEAFLSNIQRLLLNIRDVSHIYTSNRN